MILTYSQCIESYGNDYQIQKAVNENKLFKIEKGVYSDAEHVSDLAIITFKYPDAVFTMNSAFFYHGLTDDIPKSYYIATKKSARGIRDTRVKQCFIPEDIFNCGLSEMHYWDADIRIYDKERMLIELLRFKNTLPYDYYKEVLGNYRDIVYELDIPRIEEYAHIFPKRKMIMNALRSEVF